MVDAQADRPILSRRVSTKRGYPGAVPAKRVGAVLCAPAILIRNTPRAKGIDLSRGISQRMKLLACVLASAVLMVVPAAAVQQQPTETEKQSSKDVPHQKPGETSPDVGKQQRPSPNPPSSGSAQQKEDVPEQKPTTNNPDIGKRKHPAPKKRAQPKSTDSSTHL